MSPKKLKKRLEPNWGRKVHIPTFVDWYTSGVKMSLIAARFRCTVTCLKLLRKKLNLPVRSTGRPKGGTVNVIPQSDLVVGDVVQLSVESPAFDGVLAYVTQPTAWGAYVEVPVFQYGRVPGRASYRALHSEMILFRKVESSQPVLMPPVRPAVSQPAPREFGYDDSPCVDCGAFRLRRNGACLVCEACGKTTGCS